MLFFKFLNEFVQLAMLDAVGKVKSEADDFKDNEVDPSVCFILCYQKEIAKDT